MDNLFTSYYSLRNYLHSVILLAAMLILLGLLGWLLMGPIGIIWFLLIGSIILIGATRISPRFILLLHGARALGPEEVPYMYEVLYQLVRQAGIKHMPTLYYIPDRLMTIFTTGLSSNAAIVFSYSIVRNLNDRELTAVLAHEVSHISGNDLLVKLVADVIARLTVVMAFTGFILVLIYLPLYALKGETVPWALLIVLLISPNVNALLQLALSRSREFRADLEAAKLTDDPLSLASALEKIESYQMSWIERIFIPNRRIRVPLLLRSHPLVTDRVNRLKKLAE